MAIISRADLERVLSYVRPRNLNVYQEAFVHRSALRGLNASARTGEGGGRSGEGTCRPPHRSNERLEFLGDVVFGIAVTDYLYDRYPDEDEGFLTRLRIRIVKGSTLASFAVALGIDRHVVVSGSTTVNANILEDCFEALVGAIHVDYRVVGLEAVMVRRFVFGVLGNLVRWDEAVRDDNYKDVLLRHLQKTGGGTPSYTVTSVEGDAHRPVYRVALTIDGSTLPIDEDEGAIDAGAESGSGTETRPRRLVTSARSGTKRDAEQACALEMLRKLDVGQSSYLLPRRNATPCT